MQPTDRPGPSRDELVMTTRQQPQDLPVILERDRPQVPVPQRDDRSRTGVVRVGLVLAARVQQPRPRRQRGRHIDNGLARTRRAAAPTTRRDRSRLRPPTPAVRTAPPSATAARVVDDQHAPTARRQAVRRRRSPRRCAIPCAGSIPMMNTTVLLDQKWNAAAGTPDAGMPFLFRATPQHGNRRDGLIARKPTRRRQGILETTRRHPRRYETNRSA